MEKIIHGQPIKKGQIVEITIPNIERPIKAVVLDIIGYSTGGNSAHYVCIMYAQKRLFKASFEHNWSIEDNYDDDLGTSKGIEIHYYYSDLKYEEIIVEYCEIPDIPSDI
jgi:hypothetical protein|nr:MAG TPA: hypothetical protein [Crassvirales sp.]